MKKRKNNNSKTKVVVVTTVMLSFISFWRAAAIVLNDLGSSAYYVGGIAEEAVGSAAPWFILGVMLFSYAVRAVYVESCAMFTRGGVYRVVKEAMGGTLAKLSVSALMFDYILTGPISGVSAGQYIVGLVAQLLNYAGYEWSPSPSEINYGAAGIAVVVTLYFWWRNVQGIHESSTDALRIMHITSVMVVILIAWSGYTILTDPQKQKLPPAPVPHNLTFNRDAVGWIPDIFPHALQELPTSAPPATDASPTATDAEPHFGINPNGWAIFGLIGILIAFGHSFLAMSGEESLAQVNRELEYPKHKNLMRAGLVIFAYSLLFTSLVSFFAYAMIPDDVRPQYFDNLISGISLYLAGPMPLKLLFQAFIVVVGFLMLAGAVNTSLIGANGVLNRVSEDGVLTDWFRAPHRKYGTTARLINLIAILQLVTILVSRGNVYMLGEAYAFGVIWSFAFKGLAMVVLRFKDKSPRVWKVPLNFYLGNLEIPFGLGVIVFLLFSVAGINLLTKEVATVSGVAFTLVFFTLFLVSEHINHRRNKEASAKEMDEFGIENKTEISNQAIKLPPNALLCPVRNSASLSHLDYALERSAQSGKDLIVLNLKLFHGLFSGYKGVHNRHLFTKNEQALFTQVVAHAEKFGIHAELLVVPAVNVFYGIVKTASELEVSEIILGKSATMESETQIRKLQREWKRLAKKPANPVKILVVDESGKTDEDEINVGSNTSEKKQDESEVGSGLKPKSGALKT